MKKYYTFDRFKVAVRRLGHVGTNLDSFTSTDQFRTGAKITKINKNNLK